MIRPHTPHTPHTHASRTTSQIADTQTPPRCLFSPENANHAGIKIEVCQAHIGWSGCQDSFNYILRWMPSSRTIVRDATFSENDSTSAQQMGSETKIEIIQPGIFLILGSGRFIVFVSFSLFIVSSWHWWIWYVQSTHYRSHCVLWPRRCAEMLPSHKQIFGEFHYLFRFFKALIRMFKCHWARRFTEWISYIFRSYTKSIKNIYF